MKKVFSILCVFAIIITLTGCNDKENKKKNLDTNESSTVAEKKENEEKATEPEESKKQENDDKQASSESKQDSNSTTKKNPTPNNPPVNKPTTPPKQDTGNSNPTPPSVVPPKEEPVEEPKDPMESWLTNEWCLSRGDTSKDFTKFYLNANYTGAYENSDLGTKANFTWSYIKGKNELFLCYEKYNGECNRGQTFTNVTKIFDYGIEFDGESAYDLCSLN